MFYLIRHLIIFDINGEEKKIILKNKVEKKNEKFRRKAEVNILLNHVGSLGRHNKHFFRKKAKKNVLVFSIFFLLSRKKSDFIFVFDSVFDFSRNFFEFVVFVVVLFRLVVSICFIVQFFSFALMFVRNAVYVYLLIMEQYKKKKKNA